MSRMSVEAIKRYDQNIRQIDELHDRWYKKVMGGIGVGLFMALVLYGPATDTDNDRQDNARFTLLFDEAVLATGALALTASAASQSYALATTARYRRQEEEIFIHLAAEPQFAGLALELQRFENFIAETESD